MQKAVSPQRRAQLNGTRWALLSMVSAGAVTFFGHMLDRAPFPGGYQVVFLISFVAAVLNLYYFAQVRVPPFDPGRLEQTANIGFTARVLAFLRPLTESPQFVRYNLASLAYRFALNLPVALYSIYWVNDLKATDTWIGLRGTVGYVALVAGYRFWGRVANRMGHRRVLLICGTALGLYPLLTALAPAMQWLLPVAVLWGFAAAGVDIGLFDMLLAVCPDGRQPSFAAAAQMLMSVVSFVAPLMGAALAQGWNVQAALFVIGGLQLVSASLFLLLPSREQEELER